MKSLRSPSLMAPEKAILASRLVHRSSQSSTVACFYLMSADRPAFACLCFCAALSGGLLGQECKWESSFVTMRMTQLHFSS